MWVLSKLAICSLIALIGVLPANSSGEVQSAIFPVRQLSGGKERFGYINSQGKVVIPFKFDEAHAFRNGLARVEAGKTWQYIDTTGKIIMTLDDEFIKPADFREGRARVNRGGALMAFQVMGGCWGYIDVEGHFSGNAEFLELDDFFEGLAAVKTAAGWGYVDSHMALVLPAINEAAEAFCDGRAAVRRNGKWGFIDRAGSLVIPPKYDRVLSFSESLAAVQWGDQYGFIDRQGKLAFQFDGTWDTFSRFTEGLAPVLVERKGLVAEDATCNACGAPLRGLKYGLPCPHCGEIIEGGKRWGYVNRDGVFQVPAQFVGARSFSQGLAAVRFSEGPRGWGFVDHKGAVVIKPSFADVSPEGFRNGLARVGDSDVELDTYIDATGRVVWQTK